MRPLFVIGTAGLAREMAQLASQVDRHQQWEFFGFISTSQSEVGKDLGWGKVVGDDDWLLASDLECDLLLGIGHPEPRWRAVQRYVQAGDRFGYPNFVHPSAVLDARHVEMGRGNVVTAGCVLTTDIRLGDFNLLNWHATVGHDAEIGSASVVNPAASISGAVTIGDRVLVGTGARVLEGRSVGAGATVGAGAVVTHDVPAATVVIGVPARPIETVRQSES